MHTAAIKTSEFDARVLCILSGPDEVFMYTPILAMKT